MTKNVYRYKTSGDEVKVGDKVRYPGFGDGKVLELLQPESREAKEWGLPEGAVFLGGFFGIGWLLMQLAWWQLFNEKKVKALIEEYKIEE